MGQPQNLVKYIHTSEGTRARACSRRVRAISKQTRVDKGLAWVCSLANTKI